MNCRMSDMFGDDGTQGYTERIKGYHHADYCFQANEAMFDPTDP